VVRTATRQPQCGHGWTAVTPAAVASARCRAAVSAASARVWRASCAAHAAAGEVLARSYRHPWYVDRALRAGATWEQVADAAGCSEELARAEYRSWAEGERRARAAYNERRWADREGRFGMDDAEYAAAMRRADQAQPDGAAERAAAGPGAILCAHADRDGQGAHWLHSGEKCKAPEAARESQMEAGQ